MGENCGCLGDLAWNFTQIYINLKIIIEFEFAYNLGPIRAILIEKSKIQPFQCPKTQNS